MLTKATLIIPTYNRGEVLAETIRMAADQDYADYEVIVVDQDPVIPHVVYRAIADAKRPVRLIRLAHPNLPAARNVGVRAANGEIIIFIDDDVVIGSEYVRQHVRHYSDSAVGGVMGLTLPPRRADEEAEIRHALHRFYASDASVDGVAQVTWMLGCNCSYRKSAIVVGGMSVERLTGSACSERCSTLAIRVRHLGNKLLFDPQIRLVHLEIVTGGCENRPTEADLERRLQERCRLQLFFSLKNRSIFGVRGVVSTLWGSYRNFAFNRSSFKSARGLVRSQIRFIRNLTGAIRMARSGVAQLPMGAAQNVLRGRIDT